MTTTNENLTWFEIIKKRAQEWNKKTEELIAKKPKLCVNCKHCANDSYYNDQICVRFRVPYKTFNPVTGETLRWTEGKTFNCHSERHSTDEDKCTMDAKFFVKK